MYCGGLYGLVSPAIVGSNITLVMQLDCSGSSQRKRRPNKFSIILDEEQLILLLDTQVSNMIKMIQIWKIGDGPLWSTCLLFIVFWSFWAPTASSQVKLKLIAFRSWKVAPVDFAIDPGLTGLHSTSSLWFLQPFKAFVYLSSHLQNSPIAFAKFRLDM